MSTPDPLARIWLTYKTRMHAERRYQRYALFSHLSLSWYAFLGIVFSIYQTNFSQYLGDNGASQAYLVISVLTFGLSLIIYGFKFDEAARVHRDCYLRMQAIWQSSDSEPEKLQKYSLILDQYPNHAPRDWKDLLFESWLSNRALRDTQGNEIYFSQVQIGVCIARRILWFTSLAAIFLLPVAIGIYWLLND